MAFSPGRGPILERKEAIMYKLTGYWPPTWTKYLIKLMHYYGIKIKYIRTAALCTIEKLVKTCHEHKLNF